MSYRLATLALLTAATLLAPGAARAHCDTLDGPVVKAAERALAAGKPDLALAWVRPADEAEIRDAFTRTRAVRGLSPEARAVADRWFFETLVRVHRAGEGAPFAGLRPAGLKLEPGVAAAEAAIAAGKGDALAADLAGAVGQGVRARLAELERRRAVAERSVADGRAYVAAYVDLVHWVERVHGAIGAPPGPAEADAAHAHHAHEH